MLKISLDLDNTLFDWNNYYNSKFGEPKSDYEVTRKVATILKSDKVFWMEQPLINMPNFIPHCYCTSRIISKDWIKQQLLINNLPKAPIYQVRGYSLSKATQLKRSGASVHIDDSLSVFIDLNSKGIPCLLLDAPHNQDWGPIGRIYNIDIDEIEDIYYLFKNTIFPNFKELVK